jgi:hypothetical protein
MTEERIEMLPGETEDEFLKRTWKARKARADAAAREMAEHLATLEPTPSVGVAEAHARRMLAEERALTRMHRTGR